MIRTKWGHCVRFDLIADRPMPIVTDKILWYGLGVGGRIFDLPRHYQDAVARAVQTAHPRSFNRRALLYCLVSGRFKPSTHRKLTGLTVDEVRVLCRDWKRAAASRRRRDDELEFERFATAPTCDKIDD